MAKEFNVTAVCMPEIHYMVNIDERLRKVKAMVDAGKYFTINRARQYGKTTTLMALENYLQGDYYVVSMDFQTFDNVKFRDANSFSQAFAKSFFKNIIMLNSKKKKTRKEIRSFRCKQERSYKRESQEQKIPKETLTQQSKKMQNAKTS